LLLLTGDLADDGTPETYARLHASLLTVGCPFVVLPGNHDDRAALQDELTGEAVWPGRRLDMADLTLLMLDTSLPGRDEGEVIAEHREWLEAQETAGRRTVLVMHHPPFKVGIPGMDAIACRGGDRLLPWLASRPEVEAVLCGHVHRHVVTSFGGKVAHVAPSTVHQIALEEGALAWTLEPAGFLVHDLLPGLPLRTHYVPLGDYPATRYED
jgi:3',5'-cyclic AMP phosphodiesterase CpdA